LKIKHIIVCGHYGCGGIRAAIEDKDHGSIDNWLQHIRNICRFHKIKLDALETDADKCNLLCELNIGEQVLNVCKTTIVKHVWNSSGELSVHGWIYDIKNGLLQDLGICITRDDDILILDNKYFRPVIL
jgi:carbonic anhydrase